MKTKYIDQPCFRDHQQAQEGLPVWNAGQTRYAVRARREGARRKARAQRSMSVRQRQEGQTLLPGVGKLL